MTRNASMKKLPACTRILPQNDFLAKELLLRIPNNNRNSPYSNLFLVNKFAMLKRRINEIKQLFKI